MTIEKMYGSYSDADLNDWERFPMNANVLTSSAFGAWLLRRDERRDKAILKADYENRLKADMVAMFEELQKEIDAMPCLYTDYSFYVKEFDVSNLIQEKINALKAESEDKE